jgi:hypothetical protein
MRKVNRSIQIVFYVVIVLLAFVFFGYKPKAASVAVSESPNTPGISFSVTPSTLDTHDAAIQTPTATESTVKAMTAMSCSSVSTRIKKLSSEFMTAHKAHEVTSVLTLISPPTTIDEETQLAYLQGTDTADGPRLYQLAQFGYTTVSFALGSLTTTGTSITDRGLSVCTLSVHETRKTVNSESFTEETVTRYLDFELDELGNVALEGFREKGGAKYSGFN